MQPMPNFTLSTLAQNHESYEFGENIRRLRLTLGLTQKSGAERIGVSRTQLSRWENQKRAPKQKSIEQIARGYRVDVTILLPGLGNKNVSPAGSEDSTKGIKELGTQLSQCRGQRDALRSAVTELLRIEEKVNNGSVARGEFDRGWMRVKKIILDWEHEELTTWPT